MGYIRAGFEVVGVDSKPQPNYPGEFHQADALTFPLDGFDVIHASPECDGYSVVTLFHGHQTRDVHPLSISAIRERLVSTGKPYVIENVHSALRAMHSPILLCGTMFGLQVSRHRLFESNVYLYQPAHLKHRQRTGKPGSIPKEGDLWCITGHFGQKDRAQRAMGIDWMETQTEIGNALPPDYTLYIGRQIMHYIKEQQPCNHTTINRPL